jgi:RNA recognition motif-containing protein
MRIFARDLAPDVTEDDLREAFRGFGQVSFVKINQEEGLVANVQECSAMIGMPIKLEAKAAIAGLHGKKLKGKSIKVNEAGVRSYQPE